MEEGDGRVSERRQTAEEGHKDHKGYAQDDEGDGCDGSHLGGGGDNDDDLVSEGDMGQLILWLGKVEAS